MMLSNQTEPVAGVMDTRAALEAQLDAALAATFPASDPVAITICEQPEPRTARPDSAAAP